MIPPPCGYCGRARIGIEKKGDCHFCWLALNNPKYRAWRTPKPRVTFDELAKQRRH